MSKAAKPAKPEPDAAATEGGADGEETAKKKGLGLIPMVAAAVVAAGVAGGAAFVLAPGGSPAAADCASAEHGDENAADPETDSAHDGERAGPCPVDIASAETDDRQGKKEKKTKRDSGGHGGGDKDSESGIKPIGEVQHSDAATFLVLDPMVVSIQPIGRSKHLKVALVLETNDEGAARLLDSGFYIQDVLNTFLRSVDATVLEDPASMSRLRAQILRRIRAIVPDAEISNVLITEFLLT